MSFDYTAFFRQDLPPAANAFGGFPQYNFVGGHNDADSVPVMGLVDALSTAMRKDGRHLATYGMNSGAQGYLPLRTYIAQMLENRAGLATDPTQILVTTGSLQGLDLVNNALLSPGDTVVVEDVSYGGALGRLRSRDVDAKAVEMDKGGMCMDSLASILRGLADKSVTPKFIYTIPTVQNPSGTVLSLERRQQMLALARQHGVPIFEDDCYADLLWEGTRPAAIRSLDDKGQVIYCGTFSKSIAPALRIGYVVADWPVMSRLLPLKTDGGCGALEQKALAEFCPSQFDSHVDKLRQVLKGKCETMVAALEEEFGASAEFAAPNGGIFIWVTLPDQVDTDKLSQIAGAQGVAINPGSEWSADPDSGRHRMRLCFGNASQKSIRNGIVKLAEICHREFGVPLRGANVER